MGLWSTVKGWLNIGGVDVKLWKYSEPLQRSNPVITGAALLKTKSDKTILGMEFEFVEEFTSGKDEERKTERKVLGSVSYPEHEPGVGYPFDLKAGEQKEQPFTLYVTLSDRLQNYGGVLGAVGKFAAFAASEKLEYFLVATAKVKGVAFSPSHKVPMKIAK
jgi:hypothetical protein